MPGHRPAFLLWFSSSLRAQVPSFVWQFLQS